MNTIWKTFYALGVGVGCVCFTTGCNPNAKEVDQLKAKVARLEKRMSEIEQALPSINEKKTRQADLRTKFNQRYEEDKKKFTQKQLDEAEEMYQVANRSWSPESLASLTRMIEKYPYLNRTGCAALYLAQNSVGPDAEKAFRNCIENFNDCYYGDGVQVGAYARYLLANYYKKNQELEKAETLYKEIKDSYPESIDHKGRLLVSLIK